MEVKIETLEKQIKALDNILENMPNKKWDSDGCEEVILFKLRQQIFKQLKESKSAARKSIKH